MRLLVDNANFTMRYSLSVLRWLGFWRPDGVSSWRGAALACYQFFWYMCVNGNFIIFQVGDLLRIWGELELMTSTATVLLTSCAMLSKILTVVLRRRHLQALVREIDDALTAEVQGEHIVREFNKETTMMTWIYFTFTTCTVSGWVLSAEENCLPLRAWTPYDLTKSPAFEITYTYQVIALYMLAYMDISLDLLMATLMALCRCRLRLTQLHLETLTEGLKPEPNGLLSVYNEQLVNSRLRACIQEHQETLAQARCVEACFSEPFLAQFSVSSCIICVTLFQLAEFKNAMHVASMVSYLFGMGMQVYLYCYQGNELTVQSIELAESAYSSAWYLCGRSACSSLGVVMARTRRAATVTAGGFTALSLYTFTSIIKASYTFFTVLQQVQYPA